MYATARTSTIRMIVDTIEPWKGQIDYYEWDGHAESFELPSSDLVGLVGFSCTQDGPFHDITFAVGIMAVNDPGLARMTTYVDTFYSRLSAHKKWPMFLPSGELAGFEAVVFDGTSASPMTRVDVRPTCEITVSARITRPGEWPPR